MGNSITCLERGRWDAHPEIVQKYTPDRTDIYQDMTQPLPHYFISSGHNSYLTGDQLLAPSGTSTIEKSLRGGCRVVELDVYNGPICKHGGTLTSPVSFASCIQTIKWTAFAHSPYPVIITMENHADIENQGRMASILREVLGEHLFVPQDTQPPDRFLSPAQLMNKIVCRSSIKSSGEYDPNFRSLIYIRNTKFTSLQRMIERADVSSSSFEESGMPQSDELGADPLEEEKVAKQKAKVIARNRESIAVLQKQVECPPELRDELTEAPEPSPKPRMEAGSLHELYSYACRHLGRVYPAMWRVDSSNYLPMRAWVRGLSLAALNWQVWDKALWCNEAMFTNNGGCGYVLKPKWMREPEPLLPAPSPRRLVVRVYSAHMYQGRNCWIFKDDLFVKVNIWGMRCDTASRKTYTAYDSGRLNVEMDFNFDVRYPEMAILCITLKDDDTGVLGGKLHRTVADTLGYFALPLSTMRQGKFKLTLREPRTGRPMDVKDTWVKVGLHWKDAEEIQDSKDAVKQQGKPKDEAGEGSRMSVSGNSGTGKSNPMYAGPEVATDA